MKVLLTGGTGTFGRAFVHHCQGRDRGIARLRALGSSERSVSALMRDYGTWEPLTVLTGNVRDLDRMRQAVWGCDVVIHAAAMKRVDLINYQPEEAIKTNVLGTMNVVNAAIQAGVKTVVVVSSDKAVAPANTYGGTKFLAESYAVQQNSLSMPRGTKIICVRYGNIVGSSDSVLRVWARQAQAGQPLSINNPAHTRFVMQIEDAVELVFKAISEGVGGEIWIPFLSALSVRTLKEASYPKHPEYLRGTQPGEKDHEALLSDEEPNRTHVHGAYYLVLPHDALWGDVSYPGRPVSLPLTYRSDTVAQLSVEATRDYLSSLEGLTA